MSELPNLPFAVFDEFGQSCEDRVADHYRAAVQAAQPELTRLRGERPVLLALMGELLGVVLTVVPESDEEEVKLKALIQRTRDAMAGVAAQQKEAT